jgi:hypothetical protein
MILVLKRIVWPDGSSRPDDFNIPHDGAAVGRTLSQERRRPGAMALASNRLVHARAGRRVMQRAALGAKRT